MTDNDATVAQLKRLVLEFSQVRDWEQFHHPKDLGVALSIEVGELLEHFRFLTNAQIAERLGTAEGKREFAHELADCLWLLLRMADVCGIDLSSALQEKVELAKLKYPVEKAKGLPYKYVVYRDDAEG